MSASSGNPLWQEHLERLRRLHGHSPPGTRHAGTRRMFMSDRDPEEARQGEWTARRRRGDSADICSPTSGCTLEFFAIARAD